MCYCHPSNYYPYHPDLPSHHKFTNSAMVVQWFSFLKFGKSLCYINLLARNLSEWKVMTVREGKYKYPPKGSFKKVQKWRGFATVTITPPRPPTKKYRGAKNSSAHFATRLIGCPRMLNSNKNNTVLQWQFSVTPAKIELQLQLQFWFPPRKFRHAIFMAHDQNVTLTWQ